MAAHACSDPFFFSVKVQQIQNKQGIMGETPAKAAKMATSLDQLKEFTVVVADTGDFEGI